MGEDTKKKKGRRKDGAKSSKEGKELKEENKSNKANRQRREATSEGKGKRVNFELIAEVISINRNNKSSVMSLFNTGKNKKDKKKSTLPANKSAFIGPKGGGKANTKTSSSAGKHVGGAQRGA